MKIQMMETLNALIQMQVIKPQVLIQIKYM